MNASNRILTILASALLACSSTDSTTPDASAATTTIAITSPAAGATVMAGTDPMKSLPIGFTLANFTLVAAGGANKPGFGHLHVLVDGSACTPPNGFYDNDDTTGSPAVALLSSCPTATGPHTLTLEVHNNDHSPVNDSQGKVIASQVAVTVQ